MCSCSCRQPRGPGAGALYIRYPCDPDDDRAPDHRRGDRPVAGAGRGAGAVDAPSALLPAQHRRVPDRGRGLRRRQPACTCDPDYAAASVWGGPIAPPPLVGGDSLIGEDEVTAVPDDQRELMKGDPLRGVHAFYSASAREWWAPLRPDHRIWRRNALVAVLDKPSEFAERAVHEWSANVFRDDDGTMLSGQYRLMIRTERKKAREKKKYDAIELASYSDAEIDEIEAEYAAVRRRGAEPRLLGRRRRGRRGRPDGEGPADGHRHGVLARRDGHGSLRREAVGAGCGEPATDPAVLPPRRPERARRDAARALGSRVGPPRREPDHVRLRTHARDVADPPLHRLDGRRRLALEARVRVPGLQLRRRHPPPHRHRRAQVPGRGRPTRGRPRARGHQPARHRHDARARPPSCCRAATTARSVSPTHPVAPATSRPRSIAIGDAFSRR